MEPSPSLPVSSGPALAAGARSSPRGMVTKKRGWSVVSKMEIQMYEYVEVAGSDSNLSSTQLSASPSVSRVSEKLRQLGAGSPTTHHLQCSVFCGGRGCKYENAGKWDRSAFTELYSHWVTDNVLAMARPSTTLFREHNLLTKLKGAGITSVVNLQLPGEHPHCGPGLEGNTGFTYNPEELMRHEIFFYNYGWPDYGVPSLPSMLDTVKVMDFACESGKVAVHCHAGLGRTGALIACYLVYSKRMSAEDAITTVRDKRPGSLQTRGQVGLVKQFSDYLHSLWQCYPGPTNPLTIQECLDRQSLVLHGDRKNSLKSLPLVVHALCSRLKELFEEKGFTFYCLSQSPPPLSPSRTAIRRVLDITTAEEEDNECWVVVSCVNDEEETERTRLPQQPCCTEVEEHFFLSLLSISECSKSNWARRTLAQLEAEFNTCWEWTTLKHTSDLTVLSASLYSFLRQLKEPLFSAADLSNMSIRNSLFSIPKVKQQTLLLVLDTLKLVMPSSLIDSHDHVTSLANHIALLVTQTASSDTLQLLVQLISEYLLKNITNEA